MGNYLTQIVERKLEEVIIAERNFPISLLQEFPLYSRKPISLVEIFEDNPGPGFICEYKRASPSKGIINDFAEVSETVSAYQSSGAFAVSVLTDMVGFKGQLSDLVQARKVLSIPILRKDFIINEYQLHESRAHGADVVLLIAACLGREKVEELSFIAHELGLEVLLEVHDINELECLGEDVDFLGVNNRDLKTFEVTLDISRKVARKKGIDVPMISESGISSQAEVKELLKLGYQGFLMGETFMKSQDPGQACREFLDGIETTE